MALATLAWPRRARCNLIFGVTGGVQGSVDGRRQRRRHGEHGQHRRRRRRTGGATGNTTSHSRSQQRLDITPVVVSPLAIALLLPLTTLPSTATGAGGTSAVTWSVMESRRGSDQARRRLHRANAAGVYHVLATSVAHLHPGAWPPCFVQARRSRP